MLALQNVQVFYPEKKRFFQRQTPLRQVLFDINLSLQSGEILALVGESGSGKSTLGNAIMGLVDHVRGEFFFQGTPYLPQSMDSLRQDMQIIFQDSLSALNPRMTVEQTLSEILSIYQKNDRQKLSCSRLLQQVQLSADILHKYPHELSGGQRQRVCIARALAVQPRILICDEIVASLDVSVQAKILNLVLELRQNHDLSIVFTTHDLQVVRAIADQVVVLSEGRIVEIGDVGKIYANPQHPYTKTLLAAIPSLGVD